VLNKEGLNLFLSRNISECLQEFNAEINIIGYGGKVDARNPLEIMALSISCNESVVISAKGADAQNAVNAILGVLEIDQFLNDENRGEHGYSII